MICTASQTDRDEKGVTENRGDAGFHDRSLPLEPDTECPRLEKAEVERRDVEPSLTDGARKIAALAPASSSLRATLCVGYPEHSHVPVLPKAAPAGRHRLPGGKCRQRREPVGRLKGFILFYLPRVE
jgi:hypothetical protein